MKVIRHEKMADGSYLSSEFKAPFTYIKKGKLLQGLYNYDNSISTIELNTNKNNRACGVYFEVVNKLKHNL